MSIQWYFEDFYAGQEIQLGTRTVTEAEIIAFATQFDPQPFHVDHDAAAASIFSDVIASGWHTCSMMMRLVVDNLLSASSSMGSPGLDGVRWIKPERAGDTLSVAYLTKEVRPCRCGRPPTSTATWSPRSRAWACSAAARPARRKPRMREFADLAAMKAQLGQEVALSDWFEITQARVDLFADATGDHQWIHVDAERAARESPYGGTVAHGFLTLAMLPAMLVNALHMADMTMGLNYGLNKVRFPAPVTVGSRVRARVAISAIDDIAGGAQVEWLMTVEREGGDKPVCVAEFLMRRY